MIIIFIIIKAKEIFILLLFFIISLVIAIKASETLVDSFADVSKNCIPYCDAKSFPYNITTKYGFPSDLTISKSIIQLVNGIYSSIIFPIG